MYCLGCTAKITLGPPIKPGIICQMLPEHNLNVLKFKERDSVKIKGVCTGYLIDVMMVRCVFVDE